MIKYGFEGEYWAVYGCGPTDCFLSSIFSTYEQAKAYAELHHSSLIVGMCGGRVEMIELEGKEIVSK